MLIAGRPALRALEDVLRLLGTPVIVGRRVHFVETIERPVVEIIDRIERGRPGLVERRAAANDGELGQPARRTRHAIRVADVGGRIDPPQCRSRPARIP